MFPSCLEHNEELTIQRDEEISTTLYLSILNRSMRSQVCEMCKYTATQEFRCTSDTGSAEPELEKIFLSYVWSLQWSGLSCAAVKVQLCCTLLGLMIWFIISKEISRNWDQSATLQNRRLTVQESCRINLEASFIFQIVCIGLHFSLSFFSFSHFTFLVCLEMSENCENPRGSWESPACLRQI